MLEKIHAPGKGEELIGIELFRPIIFFRDCLHVFITFLNACLNKFLFSCLFSDAFQMTNPELHNNVLANLTF